MYLSNQNHYSFPALHLPSSHYFPLNGFAVCSHFLPILRHLFMALSLTTCHQHKNSIALYASTSNQISVVTFMNIQHMVHFYQKRQHSVAKQGMRQEFGSAGALIYFLEEKGGPHRGLCFIWLLMVISRIFNISKFSSSMQQCKKKIVSVGYCEGLYLVKNQFVTA